MSSAGRRLPRSGIPILTYHSLDDSGSVVSVEPRRFRRQMAGLAARGARALGVGAVLDELANGARGATVGVAFDDGYENVHEEALPVLRDLGFTASVFVVAGRCGGDNRWPGQPPDVPPQRLLSWSRLATLREAGWEIGSHGLTHLPLPLIDEERLHEELEGSAERIGENVGTRPRLLAYPYGAVDERVRRATERVYSGACGTRLAWARPHGHPFEVPRIDAYYVRNHSDLWWLFGRPGRAYLLVRRLARALRRRGYWSAADLRGSAGDRRS